MEESEIKAVLASQVKEFVGDPNRLAKAIAMYVRNSLEDFHARYLSDAQMKTINPLIRNAIFSYLKDYGDDYSDIGSDESISETVQYVFSSLSDFCSSWYVEKEIRDEFLFLVGDSLDLALRDLERGGKMLLVCSLTVHAYWEDCVYLPLRK